MKKDLTKKKFGKITAIYPIGKTKYKNLIWFCKCDCGNTVKIRSGSLTSGHTKSCGCLRHQDNGKRKNGYLLSHLFSTKPKKGNKSGFRGVTVIKKRFQSRIYLGKKEYYLGTYDTPEEAHQKYLKVKEKLHFPLLKSKI